MEHHPHLRMKVAVVVVGLAGWLNRRLHRLVTLLSLGRVPQGAWHRGNGCTLAQEAADD